MSRRFLTSIVPFIAPILAFSDSAQQKTPPAPPLFYESSCPMEFDLSFAFDDYRGIQSGSWNGSFGAVTALNMTVPIARTYSAQLAGSFGLYDWAGRNSTPFKNSKSFQQQGFLTVAASRQTAHRCGWNAGIAYDWMLTNNFGEFAVDPCFDQVRGQVGYLIKGGNEIGAWAAYGIQKDHEHSQHVPLTFRGISQVNLFWCHYFKSHGYGMLWAGTPYRRGLRYESGRAGRFIVGAQFCAPVTKTLSFEGHASYMDPRGGSGVGPSKNFEANVYFGLTYSIGKRRIAKSPYMTLANNTNFMTDTNHNL